MTYSELKTERQKRYDELFEKVGLFWAFSNEQFDEGKAKNPVDDGFKYVSIGMGGYFAGQHKQAYMDGMDALKAWEKQAKKEMKESAIESEAAIFYELKNHECFYTGEIDDVVDLFEGVYTREEIRKVYKKYANLATKTERAQEVAL